MTIPTYSGIITPALNLLDKHETMKQKDFINILAKYFKLSNEELSLKYQKSGANIFNNRIAWALQNLIWANLVVRPQRAVYKINQNGQDKLKNDSEKQILNYVLDKVKNKQKNTSTTKTNNQESVTNELSEIDQTPEELLDQSYDTIKKSACSEIMEIVLQKTPQEFESLVVKLLQAMGYGERIINAAMVTSSTRDGGIDGIIKQDVLGLDKVCIQAKQYKDATVGSPDIQKFIGALDSQGANKGVFITTSCYSQDAINCANNSQKNIILIDGNDLTNYIYDYDLGMQITRTIHIKKLDHDFWSSMEDKQ